MQMEKLTKILKSGNLVIPYILLNNYKTLNIDLNEVLIISYLMNNECTTFNHKKLGNTLNIDEKEVLKIFNKLVETELITINVIKNNKGIMEEVISLDNLYNKLSFILIGETEQPKETNIYEIFEQEFGRTLSPMEYELINAWLDAGHSSEIIIHALKEAVFNGVSNLRYIDKILFEWQKKGYKKPDDIVVKKPKTSNNMPEVPNYNWLDEHE